MGLYNHLQYSYASLLSFYRYVAATEMENLIASLGNTMQMQDFCKYLDRGNWLMQSRKNMYQPREWNIVLITALNHLAKCWQYWM